MIVARKALARTEAPAIVPPLDIVVLPPAIGPEWERDEPAAVRLRVRTAEHRRESTLRGPGPRAEPDEASGSSRTSWLIEDPWAAWDEPSLGTDWTSLASSRTPSRHPSEPEPEAARATPALAGSC